MIVTVTDYNLEAFLRAERMALILARGNSNSCAIYRSDVERLQQDGALAGVTVGVLMLDQPGTSQFKRDNLWLMSVDFLPYTLLYRDGQRVDGFAGVRGHILLDRLRRAFTVEPALAFAS